MAIHRPNWGLGGDRALVNVSMPGQTTGGSSNAVTVTDAAHLVPATTGPGESALSDTTIEVAATVGDGILEWHDCPDPEGFQEELAKLPQQDIDLLLSVLASGLKAGDDPYDVAVKYERKATIDQLLRAKALVRQMPQAYRDWLLSFVEGDR